MQFATRRHTTTLRYTTTLLFAAALIAGSSATALAIPVGSSDSGSATALVTGSASGSANSGSATPGTGSAYNPNSGSAKFGERVGMMGPRIAAGIEALVRGLGFQPGLYLSCADVERNGAAPLLRGAPGFNPVLDPDGDGIACD
ncbi:excalibur calcium-binding domain-containing protein [Nocardia huaxiensis]|uniref:Excalibur calcium-binding domain-containing protein n=1 Tax=Nocardia huaxiensis TaxID=2755382 RepID=A0A7D6ZSR6_9NOCA|nr:excalibur calcium-binding domain-containing protein [Nocardia huaxiensis]QLY33025.1 excalibur calcium-binding domain-containing protein [Nocardia huaxiensis]UFS93213.1 excalibur calcium-binding domain-containing protein [Nocardia huaxiensis]